MEAVVMTKNRKCPPMLPIGAIWIE